MRCTASPALIPLDVQLTFVLCKVLFGPFFTNFAFSFVVLRSIKE